jgi:hypothetical protein
MATTAAPVKVASGAVIRTCMQLSTSATMQLEVVEWGISFDGSAAATPGLCELVNTVAIPATALTAYAAADVVKLSSPVGGVATGLTLGAGNSGFSPAGATTEGTITATRQADTQLLPPTAPYIKQFPLERGPEIMLSEFLRVRITFGTTVNYIAYVVWAE